MDATANNAELRLVTHSRAVLRALAIAMVDHSLTVYPSLAAALMPRPAPPSLAPAELHAGRDAVRTAVALYVIRRTETSSATPGCRSVVVPARCAGLTQGCNGTRAPIGDRCDGPSWGPSRPRGRPRRGLGSPRPRIAPVSRSAAGSPQFTRHQLQQPWRTQPA
jgi:hypothetical protein